MTAVLALDAGKSGCRAAAFVDGVRGPTARGPGIENVARPGALEQIREALSVALQGVHHPDRYLAVCLGLTGVLDAGAHARAVVGVLHDLVPARRVVVTSDVVTSYCGALGLRPGVVVAAGTGAITLAAGADGTLARVDGWGYLLDDAGSAFAIGRAGLREALRAGDGRGGSPTLHAAAIAEFGDLASIVERVYGAENPARTVARFARQVSVAAHTGDPVALDLLREAGRDLGRAATAAAERVLDLDTSIAVSWHGGVFDAGPVVLEPFLATVRAGLPACDPRPPRGDGLDGAAALAAAEGQTVVDGFLATDDRVDA